MEVTQINVSNGLENVAVSIDNGDHYVEASAVVGPTAAFNSEFGSDVMVGSSENKKQNNTRDQHLRDISVRPSGVQFPTSNPGVSNCYIFKSRLQEYAQKVGLSTPVYETIKEGPSHEPSFKSIVIVGGERYESLPGFFNRKAAEQSAAEIALMELSKSGDKKDSITVPVHETGLCKNLLQEYAQKMNYAIPTYICRKDDTPGRTALFFCTVEIGGIQYIGAAARTKKEAMIKAARTALLAIRSSDGFEGQNIDDKPQYSVIPGKRKTPETAPPQVETVKAKKQKKPSLKKKKPRQTQAGIVDISVSNDIGTPIAGAPIAFQVPSHGLTPSCMTIPDQENRPLKNNQLNGEASVVKDDCGPLVGVVDSSQIQVTASSSQSDGHKNLSSVESFVPLADASRNPEENTDQGVGEVIHVKSSLSGELDSCIKSQIISKDPENHSGGEISMLKNTPSDSDKNC